MEIKFTKAKIIKGWLCLKPDNIAMASEFVLKMKDNTRYTAQIKREKRSLSANAYAWVLIGKLAAKTGIDVTRVYQNLILDIGNNFDVLAIEDRAYEAFKAAWESAGLGYLVRKIGEHALRGYSEIAVYYGSSTYDSEQMSRLIDLLVQECQEQGIETLPPERLATLKDEWREQYEQAHEVAGDNEPDEGEGDGA